MTATQEIIFPNNAQTSLEAAKMVNRLQGGYVPEDLEVKGIQHPYDFREHQKTAIAFMALTKKCLILDVMGLGKTLTGVGFLKFLKDRQELGTKRRALVVTTAPNVATSWKVDGFEKFFPSIKVGVARGTKAQRRKVYADTSWEVLLTNYETVRNDKDLLVPLAFDVVIFDEVDVLGNHESGVTVAARAVAAKATRRIGMTGTLFTRRDLMGAYSIFEVLGIDKAFAPTRGAFSNYYHNWNTRKQTVWKWGSNRKKFRTEVYVKEFESLKNTAEFKKRLRPFFLRRTRDDVDIQVPELYHVVQYVEMTKEQEKLYKQAQQGYLQTDTHDAGDELSSVWNTLNSICVNTNLVGGPDSSGKMDGLMQKLKTTWQDTKVVVFVNRLGAIKTLEERLNAEGIGCAKILGSSSDKQRAEALQKFRNDPECRVFLGTRSLVRGLNLQVARVQVNLQILPNPGEQEQVAGRVARDGSTHKDCLVVTFITLNTLEYQWYQYVSSKSAVSSHMLEESSAIFQQLSERDFYALIKS